MTEQIKSGKELLDDFFGELTHLEGVDPDVAQSVVQLYGDGKLTNVNIANELQRLREVKINDKNK